MVNPDSLSQSKAFAGILEFPCSVERQKNGNTLIADAGSETGRGSEILEVNPAGDVVWRSDQGYRFAHAARRLKNGNTVVADTTNNRLLEVDSADRIVFSSDEWGHGKGLLSDGSRLCYPNNVQLLSEDKFIVTNRNSNDFVIVDRNGVVERKGGKGIKHPHNFERIGEGLYIAADSDQNRIVEINEADQVVWEYTGSMSWPRDANRLLSGNTLITDSKNSRVFEVTPQGKIVWEYKLGYFANLYEGVRLDNGNILMSDQQHHRVIEVTRLGQVVWEFRNFVKDVPVFDKLTNGFFLQKGEDGLPKSWCLSNRFSEGGGNFVWAADAYGKTVPCLEYDRAGALCLQQNVRVTPGDFMEAGCAISTDDLDGFACLQVAFKDDLDGLLCDAAQAPKGGSFSGSSSWTPDSFSVTVPEGAASADVRFFITGKGRAMIRDVRFKKNINIG
jgi:uncharacterized protein (UPF0248 family)